MVPHTVRQYCRTPCWSPMEHVMCVQQLEHQRRLAQSCWPHACWPEPNQSNEGLWTPEHEQDSLITSAITVELPHRQPGAGGGGGECGPELLGEGGGCAGESAAGTGAVEHAQRGSRLKVWGGHKVLGHEVDIVDCALSDAAGACRAAVQEWVTWEWLTTVSRAQQLAQAVRAAAALRLYSGLS